MKKLLRSLAMAFSMYSILPAPRVEWKAENMRYAFCFFPLIGVVIGAAEFGWLWLCRLFGVGPGLTAAVATAIPVLLSAASISTGSATPPTRSPPTPRPNASSRS